MSYQELMEEYLKTQEKYLKMQEENTDIKEKYAVAQEEIVELKAKVENQQLQINVLNRYLFGSKRESIKNEKELEGGEQCTLFSPEETEELAEAVREEAEKIVVYRKKGAHKKTQAGIKRSALKGAKIIQKEYPLDKNDEKCEDCGEKLEIIGKEIVRKDVEITPPEIRINVYVRYKYKCKDCEKKAIQGNDPVKIMSTEPPRAILPHSFVSPTLATEVIYEKYYKGVPLYRQEQTFDDAGLVIPRSMMANWCIKLKEYYFEPIYNLMLKEIKANSEVIHADESKIQCNKEKGRKASSNSYMWLIATGKDEKKKGAIYKYSQSRSTKVAQELLEGYKGILVSDGYCVYDKIDDVLHAECWTHARRKFYDSVPLDSNKQLIQTAEGYKGIEMCDELFKVEREIEELNSKRKLTNEEIVSIRKEKSEPIFKKFYDWVNSVSQKIIMNDKLKDAITYAINQRKQLSEFLNDGRIPLSNSLAERAIKPFVIGRKNWLFADTVAGAETNAVIYSIVESAKMNHLNTRKYIQYLLEELSQLDNLLNEEKLQKYMPWSAELPEEIKNADDDETDTTIRICDIDTKA